MKNNRLSAFLFALVILFGVTGAIQAASYAAENDFVPITEIIDVPDTATAGAPLELTGTVIPGNATNQNITWSVKDAGTTGATIDGNILDAMAAGTAVVTATINGSGFQVPGVFKAVATTYDFGHRNVALKTDGSLWAWGHITIVENGRGFSLDYDGCSYRGEDYWGTLDWYCTKPIRIGTDNDWSEISSDGMMALKTDGSLWAWGMIGHLAGFINGFNDTDFYDNCTFIGTYPGKWYCQNPVRFGTDKDWLAIAGYVDYADMEDYRIALKTDGSLWAWGENTDGQLGFSPDYDICVAYESDGDLKWRCPNPVRIGTDNNWVAVSAAGRTTLAIKTDGSLWAWGENTDGQLGFSRNHDNCNYLKDKWEDEYWMCSIPSRVGTDTNWSVVSAGRTTLALKTDGSLWAWGWNYYGQFGDGTRIGSNTPVRIGADKDWSAIKTGVYVFALKTDGSLWAWGLNNGSSIGVSPNNDGCVRMPEIICTIPIRIGKDNDWAAVTENNAALKTDGSLWTWGNNIYGQLGDGTTISRRLEYKQDFVITVNPAVVSVVLTGISVIPPSKLEYTKGDALDLTGMAVTAIYSDDSTENATARAVVTPVNGSVLNEVGTVTVRVSYEGFEKSFTVTVEPESANYAALDGALVLAGTKNAADYTAESWAILAAAVSDGESVPRNLTANEQGIINAAALAITDAIAGLVVKPIPANYTVLDNALELSGTKNAAEYTAESWAVLAAAVSDGEAVPRNLTVNEQGIINAAALAITDAIAGLVYKDDDETDNAEFLQERAAGILKNGLSTNNLRLDGKVLTLVIDGREFVLSTNANNRNISGEIALGDGYYLKFDIKGNGSNIKEFKIIQK